MLIEKIIDHIDLADKTADYERVLVANEDLAKRLHHLTTNRKTDIAIHLSQGKHLRVGDVLYRDDNRVIVVDVLPEDVLVIAPKTIDEMGEIAHELGNRHLPAQFINSQMIVQYDYLVDDLLKKHHLNYQRRSMKLSHPFLHVGHHHEY